MSIHQLIIFWRDSSARCFTAWHFQPAPRDPASQRATQIYQAIRQLTSLQIYGAVLNTTPLPLHHFAPVPVAGLQTRLQVSLSPTNPAQVGNGVIKFSIPGPTTVLARAVNNQDWQAKEWQLLEQEIIPYLCSPSGVKASLSPHRLRQATIVQLNETADTTKDPFAQAIAHTEQALATAQRSFQQTPSPSLASRVTKYQARLQHLQTWQTIERGCVDLASHASFIAQDDQPINLKALSAVITNSLSSLPSQPSKPSLSTNSLPQAEESMMTTPSPVNTPVSPLSFFLPLTPTDPN